MELGFAVRQIQRSKLNEIPSPTRREVLAGAGAALAAPILFAAAPTEGADYIRTVSGFVYDDAEGDRKRRPGSGLPGVMVSNGRDIAITRADGSWSLAAREDEPLFVVKPSGWATPLGTGGVPDFAVPAADGILEFALRRNEEASKFDVLLFADTQPANSTELGYFRDEIVCAALGVRAAFGINHGDVVGDDLSLYGRYLDILGALRMPWHHCPGNHDIDAGTAGGNSAFATWRRTFGPTHYAFEYGLATFLVLNNVAVSPEGYCGTIGPDQLAFFENVLRHTPENRLVVVSMHIPLTSFAAPHDPRETTSDARRLLALLSARANTVSFAGHLHTTEHHYLGRDEGFARDEPHHHQVLTAASGSWWGGVADERGIPAALSRDGSPKGFHVLSVDGTSCRTRFLPVGRSHESMMRMMLSKCSSAPGIGVREPGEVLCGPLPASALTSTELVVDVFDGGPLTQLVFEIEGADFRPQPMQRVRMPDPHVVDVFARDRRFYKPWVEAAPSSHVWTAPLPVDLAPGAYRLAVSGSDEFGEPIASYMVLDVVA